MTMRAFLSRANDLLSQSRAGKGPHPVAFVIGNESADLDSITSALLYAYIHSSTPQAIKSNTPIIPLINLPRDQLHLRPELTALLRHADLRPSDLPTTSDLPARLHPDSTVWTLVDHNALHGELARLFAHRVSAVIDHHADEGRVPASARPRIIAPAASCTSLVVNHSRDAWNALAGLATSTGLAHHRGEAARVDDAVDVATWDAQVAQLAVGAILIDTANLAARDRVTEHDCAALRFLEAKIHVSRRVGPTYDRDAFFREVDAAKSAVEQLSLHDMLRKDFKQWSECGGNVGISSCVKPMEYLLSKHRDPLPAIVQFAQSRHLHLFAIMTAHSDAGSFARQLLLVALKEGPPLNAARRFVAQQSQELQLDQKPAPALSGDHQPPYLRLYEQKNTEASRKRVGPLLRQAIRESD